MRKKRLVLFCITIIWTGIIISFSLQPAEVSSDMSSGFGRWLLERFLPGIYGQLESIPVQQLEFWHTVFRKCGHFAEYFMLGVLWRVTLWEPTLGRRGTEALKCGHREIEVSGLDCRSTEAQRCGHSEIEALGHNGRACVMYEKCNKVLGVHCEVLIAQVLCTLSAVADETVQLFVPGRSGQVTDVLLDSAGALAAMAAITLFVRVFCGIALRLSIILNEHGR